jgi:hypothetical protein
MADDLAMFRSLWFWASFRDFLTGTTGKGSWASGVVRLDGYSEFKFEVIDAFVWADQKALNTIAVLWAWNKRAALGRAFARAA